MRYVPIRFQFLGIPPKGELRIQTRQHPLISRLFPISRDPPEGGTFPIREVKMNTFKCFQFLGIPPKGEPYRAAVKQQRERAQVSNF